MPIQFAPRARPKVQSQPLRRMKSSARPVAVVGAGLVGALLAGFLVRRGHRVAVFEKRSDPRNEMDMGGRSINLALSKRGIEALERVGLVHEVLEQAIPMPGRILHGIGGKLVFTPYGITTNEHLNSISRSALNCTLLDFVQSHDHVSLHFDHALERIDFQKRQAQFLVGGGGEVKMDFDVVFGTDGAGSVVRAQMEAEGFLRQMDREPSGIAYKELTIGPGEDHSFQMNPNALHIWPRGRFMLIALPNTDRSFTCTLFIPERGENSMEGLTNPKEVIRFFKRFFRDSVPLMEDLVGTFFRNPTDDLSTIRTFPWADPKGRALLLGDAAHAVIPFMGQGMNCGFEDCRVLDDLLQEGQHPDWPGIFSEFQKLRKPQADAIAQMSIENYREMSERTADEHFLFLQEIETALAKKFPDLFKGRHALVSFTNVSYVDCYRIGEIQESILEELCKGKSRIDQMDWDLAQRLIQEKLAPEMKRISF